VREAVIGFLRASGATTLFGNPGSTELPMFRNWPDDFRYVLGLNEAIAVAMADGFARATGAAAAVNLHSSAGVGHGLGNLVTAFRNHAPVVIIAGQQARALLPSDPFLGAESPGEFPKPFVKWAIEPARAQDVPLAVARAFAISMQAPRGPTLVSVPADDWDMPGIPVQARPHPGDPQPSAAALAEAMAALKQSHRPAFVVGAEVDEQGAWDDVTALAERFGAAVFEAPRNYRASFPESHPLFAGFLPPHRQGVASALAGHDLALVLGAPAFTYHVETQGPFLPDGAQLVHITCDPQAAARATEGRSILGDVGAAIRSLLKAAPAAGAPAPAPVRRPPLEAAPARPIPVGYLMQTLARTRPSDSVIVEEAPSSRAAMQARLPIDTPGGFFTTASGGLGYGLPAAVGVALANPGRRTIAIIGDGSSLYAIQALWTAVQWALPLTIVIVNNGGYEALKTFGRMLQIPPVGVELPGLDFCALARGQGCEAVRIEQGEELAAALGDAFAAPGPRLIDVAVGASEDW
jgi:benzoylformate decarboxylase